MKEFKEFLTESKLKTRNLERAVADFIKLAQKAEKTGDPKDIAELKHGKSWVNSEMDTLAKNAELFGKK
jgi:hypothetical protein